MSSQQIRKFLDAENKNCTCCGMSNQEHLLRTGRGLHLDREVPGSSYTTEGCTLLCNWCHRHRHHQSAKPMLRKIYKRGGTAEIVVHEEDLATLKKLAEEWKVSEKEAFAAAVASLYANLEFFKKHKKFC